MKTITTALETARLVVQSSTKGFLWYITFWAFLPSEQSLTIWVKLTKGRHNYLTLSRHHLYWNEPVVRNNIAGIVKLTTVFSWPSTGAGKVSETCIFVGLKKYTWDEGLFPIFHLTSLSVHYQWYGCAIQSRATILKKLRPLESRIYFSNSIPRSRMSIHGITPALVFRTRDVKSVFLLAN